MYSTFLTRLKYISIYFKVLTVLIWYIKKSITTTKKTKKENKQPKTKQPKDRWNVIYLSVVDVVVVVVVLGCILHLSFLFLCIHFENTNISIYPNTSIYKYNHICLPLRSIKSWSCLNRKWLSFTTSIKPGQSARILCHQYRAWLACTYIQSEVKFFW